MGTTTNCAQLAEAEKQLAASKEAAGASAEQVRLADAAREQAQQQCKDLEAKVDAQTAELTQCSESNAELRRQLDELDQSDGTNTRVRLPPRSPSLARCLPGASASARLSHVLQRRVQLWCHWCFSF